MTPNIHDRRILYPETLIHDQVQPIVRHGSAGCQVPAAAAHPTGLAAVQRCPEAEPERRRRKLCLHLELGQQEDGLVQGHYPEAETIATVVMLGDLLPAVVDGRGIPALELVDFAFGKGPWIHAGAESQFQQHYFGSHQGTDRIVDDAAADESGGDRRGGGGRALSNCRPAQRTEQQTQGDEGLGPRAIYQRRGSSGAFSFRKDL